MDSVDKVASARITSSCQPLVAADALALSQADRLAAVGQLAGGLAHEINTPLGTISAHAEESLELLREQGLTPRSTVDLREHLMAIIRQANRCSRITSRLLQFAEPARSVRETCRAEQIIADVLRLFEPVAEAKDVQLDSLIEPHLPDAPIGPADLEQMLVDLVQNGLDACEHGGTVRVRAGMVANQMQLVVEDTGSGIAADVLERIFDPFFTTKPVGQGTGLGLSVCHGIVTSIAGRMDVATIPGCGTRVTITMPGPLVREIAHVAAAAVGDDEDPPQRSAPRWRKRYHHAISRSSLGKLVPMILLASFGLFAAGCTSKPAELVIVAWAAPEPVHPALVPSAAPAEGLTSPAPGPSEAAAVTQPVAPITPATGDTAAASASRLFANYCAGCHGEKGDGSGLAARFLYPKPRDFRQDSFRLVTTANRVPSEADLMRVIERGMPGSAMFPFGHLPESERRLLAGYVRQLANQGLEDRLKKDAADSGEQLDPDELKQVLAMRTQPGEPVQVPADLPPSAPESIARGKALYLAQCATCHGTTGKGDGVQDQRDERGMPIRPRDFTRGIFKGGRDRDQLYARITLGVPGTPMPASVNFQPAQIGDLINFILSLSDASTPERVEHRRRQIVAQRSAVTLSEEVPENAWQNVPATAIVVSPLWWRDYGEPELRVQAMHDGQKLAVRLTWHDATQNAHAVRPQDFPDMAAIQFFKGEREPFLGMGGPGAPVDVWLWNSAQQSDLQEYADVDTTYPHMAVDQYPFETPGTGARPHPTVRQPRQFLTAWAAGNLRSDPTRHSPSTSLQAQGPGSLTMRPPISQAVEASGRWTGQGWTVVFLRPLGVPAAAGLSLAPSDRVSAAIAIWDGAASDRNGQKLVSIWHDFKLD